jgi:hypothetical protein
MQTNPWPCVREHKPTTNYNTFIFIIQLAMADDTLTLESDEQGPNKIESLKCLLQTSSAWDSFHPFFQSVS